MSDPRRPAQQDREWHLAQRAEALAKSAAWDDLRQLLTENADCRLGNSHFMENAFNFAAKAGQSDLVALIVSRGFTVPDHGGAWLLQSLAIYGQAADPGIKEVITFLVREKHADPESAIRALAARSERTEMMEVFRQAGADIQDGASSFFLALYEKRPQMMAYLYDHGADLYHPEVVAAQYGRRNQVRDEALEAYRGLLEKDRMKAAALYAETGPAMDSGSFKEPAMLLLAARAGKFFDVLAALQERAQPLTAQDIVHGENGAPPVLAVLAARGELEALFDPAHWQGRGDVVRELHAALGGYRAEQAISLDSYAAAAARRQLRVLSAPRRNKWRLDP